MAPAMTGEDFAWYLQQRPGAFVWIGNGPTDGGRELHNANYDFNDAVLPAASGYLAAVAKRALGWAGHPPPATRAPGFGRADRLTRNRRRGAASLNPPTFKIASTSGKGP